MTLTLQLDPDEELALQKKAMAAGIDIPAYAMQLIRSDANRLSLDEILAPVRQKFELDGMTDEEVAQRYDAEKHAQRAARRGRPFDE